MKLLYAALAVAFILIAIGCTPSKTTHTLSSSFSTLAEKQAFLESYVLFRRNYDDLHYEVSYMDGSTGMVPGPSEWDIRIKATIPTQELDLWSDGLSPCDPPETAWVKDLSGPPVDPARFDWFASERRVVGLDRGNRIVLYRNHTY